MIKIKNLTKIYKISKKESCTAIDNISLDLPDKGLIFILGKSGSGKSTLLNMIGTLDDITSGDLIVDGYNVAEFTPVEQQEYRSCYLGFIFQSFVLLDEFTVYENVKLALDIVGSEEEERVTKAIKDVGLEGMENKFPNELSGGQRQRVAIARALVKKPGMLLCDEPTGNLDFKTSNQILDLLKKESKDKLIIVVSHNIVDAENYADRIIELKEGKIISDKTKDEEHINAFIDNQDEVILPHHKDLSFAQINQLNEKVKVRKFKVKQNEGSFKEKEFKVEDVEEPETFFKTAHLKKKNLLKISSMFSRKNRSNAIYTMIITSLFISLLYLLQVFIGFNANDSLKFAKNDYISVVNLSEQSVTGSLSMSYINAITEDEINMYYENGYKGNIYKLYNYNFTIKSKNLQSGKILKYPSMFNYNNINESLGVLCCSEEYLKSIYGNEKGELVFLAGDAENAKSKMIITDYIADLILEDDYDKCYLANMEKISGIIYTGYKERYKELYVNQNTALKNGMTANQYLEKYKHNKLFKEFMNEVYYTLGIGYCFSSNLYEKTSPKVSERSMISNYYVVGPDKKEMYVDTLSECQISSSLEQNQMIMSYGLYNTIFGTNYNASTKDEFIPHSIKLKKLSENETGEIFYEIDIDIVKLGDYNYISRNMQKSFFRAFIVPYKIYFDNPNNVRVIKNTTEELNLSVDEMDSALVPVITTLIKVFEGFFYLILVILVIFSVSHIIIYGITSMKKNSYEIGVLKAQGTKEFDIGLIFTLQTIVVGVIISILSLIGIVVISLISNQILLLSFENLLNVPIYEMNILVLKPGTIIGDILIVWVISIISSLIPLIYLRKIKPFSIIRNNK